jgi:hypothetical protein
VGKQLVKYYDFVGKIGGLPMQMRLAMATGLPSAKADSAPDSPDNVEKFKKAIKQITGKDAPA